MARARLPEPEHPDVLVMAHRSEYLTTVADPFGAIILSALYSTGKGDMHTHIQGCESGAYIMLERTKCTEYGIIRV